MDRMAVPPVFTMVTLTIGIGQYGGGVEGKPAVAGVTSKLAASGGVVVLGAALVGGVVAGAVVGATVLGGAVQAGAAAATVTGVDETGSAHVVVGCAGASAR